MAELTTDRLHDLLPESSIFLTSAASDRDDAVQQAGEALVVAGAVDASYIAAMLDREHSVSTYVGEGIAMPHGTVSAKDSVTADALVLLRFPEGIDWNGERVTVVIGIAARGRGYIALISQLAGVLLDPARAASLRSASSSAEIYDLFA